MNWERLKKQLLGAALVLALLLGVGGIFDSTAQAQFRGRYDRRGDYARREDCLRELDAPTLSA